MKKVFFAVCCAVLLAGIVSAQNAPNPPTAPGGERGARQTLDQRVNALAERLGLTDEQKAKVKEIYEKQQKDMQALRSDTTLTGDARRTKMGEIMKATNDAIAALLTPEQKTKWEAYLKERSGGDRGPRPGGGDRPTPPDGAKQL